MILNILKKKKGIGYTKLSSEDKKKIIIKAARGANLMQKDIIDRYYAMAKAN